MTIGFGVIQEEVIDAINILQATMLAMRRAIEE
jgi:ribonuclease HII